MKNKFSIKQIGQSLVEIILVIGLSSIILPALLTGLVSSRQGKVQQSQRTQATYLLNGTVDAIRSVREKDWVSFAINGVFHPVIVGSNWSLAAGTTTINGFIQNVTIENVNRNTDGTIVATGGTPDPSTKKVIVSISWDQPSASSIEETLYMTRYLENNFFVQTTEAEFKTGSIIDSTQVTNTTGGEVLLINNNRAKWCSPALSNVTIDLPDGPPVAVSAVANTATTSIPNDVLVAIAPSDATSGKLAYLTVTANTDPPSPTLHGTFTLDSTKYSSGTYPTSLGGLTNNFKTNDVKYYKSASGSLYGLLATDLPDHEVVAVRINDGTSETFQDPVNKIYKYHTFFNTRMYGIGSGLDTGFLGPTANAAETSGAGDNNGYESNPTRAYTDNSSFATDSSSGSGNGTDCLGADKDKHRFYNYGFSLPENTTIDGIEVRLDAKADSTTGAPKICVQLSWDGGATWTAPKTTVNLSASEATYILGGAADTWGRSWSGANFNDAANFRVRVIDVVSNTSRKFSLDWVGVKVHYSGGNISTNDQAPFGYGASDLTILGNTAYVDSGGYLYTFDLSNIDDKSPTNGLDQIGCRILLDGYSCQPGYGIDIKYSSGETGTSWNSTSGPAHPDTCADGGNIELYADHQLSAVQVGTNKYIYVAVGAGTNPELDIVDVSTVPTSNIANSSCGRGSDTGWKVVGSLDLDPYGSVPTEEAANSVFAKSDGTRAYVSSNGGIMHGGIPDSDQFYIIDTTTKSNPKFLFTWPTTQLNPPAPIPPHYANTAQSGYYNGNASNIQLFPRRALTVLNGLRAVLVGQDGFPPPGDTTEPQEYQVLNLENESAPAYCGGIYFLPGFNDLTSVSEADGDNFVYMVANTMEKQLKVIQGGPDTGIYASNGTFESSVFQAPTTSAFFTRFSATVNQPAQTTIKAQVAVAAPVAGDCAGATYTYVGPNANPGSYFIPVGNTLSGVIPFESNGTYQNPNRCFRIKFWLDTLDSNITPTLYDFSVTYSP
jgi:type II secretory pathway pseudopilin PulG